MIIGRRVLGRAMVCAVAALAMCGSAVASAGVPTGDFAVFKECPRFTSGVNLCVYVKVLGGQMTIGQRTVPIERPIVLQGGIAKNESTFAETFVGALNGETLSRTPQTVPGGLFGAPLYATLELIPPANEVDISMSNLENREGTAVTILARIRLESRLLGSECYIGSRSRPIVLHLTTGTTRPAPPNRPISGELGELSLRDRLNLLEAQGDVLVDNTFSLPVATGCGGPTTAPLIDSLIDQALDLPSPDGHNTIIENNTLTEATAEGVTASESG